MIGVNLDFLGLFFFITDLLKFYGENPNLPVVEISLVFVGSLMIFIGLRGSRKNNLKDLRSH